MPRLALNYSMGGSFLRKHSLLASYSIWQWWAAVRAGATYRTAGGCTGSSLYSLMSRNHGSCVCSYWRFGQKASRRFAFEHACVIRHDGATRGASIRVSHRTAPSGNLRTAEQSTRGFSFRSRRSLLSTSSSDLASTPSSEALQRHKALKLEYRSTLAGDHLRAIASTPFGLPETSVAT